MRDPGVGVGGHAGVLTFHPGGAAVSEAGDAHGHTSLALDLIQEGLHNDSQGNDLVFFITANKIVFALKYTWILRDKTMEDIMLNTIIVM